MSPEKRKEKNEAKRLRAIEHRNRRNEKYFEKIRQANNVGYHTPLYSITKWGYTGSWPDSNSPTGYSQICSYQGICQSPCNGDC